MYYDIDAVIEGLTYDELVKILKEQNMELLYLKSLRQDVRQEEEKQQKELIYKYNDAVKKYNLLLEQYNKKNTQGKAVVEQYNKLLKQYKNNNIDLDLEGKIKALEKDTQMMLEYIEDIEKKQFKPNTTRGCSLSKHQKEQVIKGILNGLSDSEISRLEKIDRKTIKKIRTAGYKSKKTNKEILSIINHLLKINQNPDYIRKLKDLKCLYMSQ